MVEFLEYGDIFKLPNVDGLGHGCNCAGAMGKGIALTFKKKYPQMYLAYRKRCQNGQFVLGDVFVWENSSPTIFNLATQKHWRGKAEVWAIEASLSKMFGIAEQKSLARLAIPRIGAGLGGLDWELVKNSISKIGNGYSTVHLIVVENFNPPDLFQGGITRHGG